MSKSKLKLSLIAGIIVMGLVAYLIHNRWYGSGISDSQSDTPPSPKEEAKVLQLSLQARKNLELVVLPVKLQSYWRKIQIPGTIVDRPGVSDRNITAPAVSVVLQIHAFPGNTVKPGDRLVTLRLTSEYLQNAQTEMFKTAREVQLETEQRNRIESLSKSGAVAETRLIEIENQLKRLNTTLQAYRQDLLTRGLTSQQIESVAEGKFTTEIDILVPLPNQISSSDKASTTPAEAPNSRIYEVEKLKVELGQQVQAGQTLCELANHKDLYIEGHSFKREAPYLEQAMKQNWPVEVEFTEDSQDSWSKLEQKLFIRHLANAVDAENRTFSFFVPLENQSHQYEKDNRKFLVWRFRPGQRVSLQVPLEEIKDVLVIPIAGIVREGADVFVFRQNGDLFDRRSVHLLYEDRQHAVLANDGSVAPGWYLAQNGAASLNRVLKAQAASGAPVGVHVHPDGTVHGAH